MSVGAECVRFVMDSRLVVNVFEFNIFKINVKEFISYVVTNTFVIMAHYEKTSNW